MCSHSAAPHRLFFHRRARHTWFVLLPVCHTDLAHSALAPSMRAVSLDEYSLVVVVVVLDTGSDVTVEITAHIAIYALQGMLHGNHSMSLSGGFVTSSFRGGGEAFDLESQCMEILLLSLPSRQMSLTLMNAWLMVGQLDFG